MRFFIIFFWPVMLFGAVLTNDGIVIESTQGDSANSQVINQIKDIDRQICGLFRVNSRTGGKKLIIQIDRNASRSLEVLSDKTQIRVIIGDKTWEDTAARQQLYGVILAQKVNEYAPENLPLPGWLAGAVDCRMQALQKSERLIKKNRYFPYSRQLYELNALPDFFTHINIRAEKLSGSSLDCYNEVSRLYLEELWLLTGSADNALLDYAILSMANKAKPELAVESTLGRVILKHAPKNDALDNLARGNLFLRDYAVNIIFNDSFPVFPDDVKKEFATIDKFELPDLDKDGKPLTTAKSYRLADLVTLLRQRKDLAEVVRLKRQQLNDFARNKSPDVRSAAQKLYALLDALQKNPDNSAFVAEYTAALTSIDRSLDQQKAVEKLLYDYECANLPAAELFGTEIREVNQPDLSLSDKVKKYIDDVEKNYSREATFSF